MVLVYRALGKFSRLARASARNPIGPETVKLAMSFYGAHGASQNNTRNAEQKVFQARTGKTRRKRRTNRVTFTAGKLAKLPDTSRGVGKLPGNFRRLFGPIPWRLLGCLAGHSRQLG